MNDAVAQTQSLSIRFHQSIGEMDRLAWNSLDGADHVFTRYEFLNALETSGCVQADTGWLPQHIAITGAGEQLLAAAPFYLKNHSYGEYVFDWAWADAYQRAGIEYYPKLIGCVPFTPATGPRLLTRPGYRALAGTLVEAGLQYAGRLDCSSVHWNFTTRSDQKVMARSGLFERLGNQFHWQNRGFADFDGFLESLASKKRKQIRRERRRVAQAGVGVDVVRARDTDEVDWDVLFHCYRRTVSMHGAIAYLNREFFGNIRESLPDNALLVRARRTGKVIASGLLFADRSALYGRYWGALDYIPDLHFEVCYYAPIEFAIDHRLERFEAGAQGSHKLARGLLPTPTWSSHWLKHAEFRRAIEDHVENEKAGVKQYMNELEQHSPFRREEI